MYYKNRLSENGITVPKFLSIMHDIGRWEWLTGLIPRYYLFRMTNTSGFFLPVAIIILYDKGFGLDFIGLAYGVYALAKLFVEIPTGYVGDWLGRRASLALGSAVRAIVIGIYPFVNSASIYLGLHVLWAIGRTFRSGTQEAWLYEILQRRFDPDDYTRIESRGNTLKLITDSATALTGGLLYSLNPASPFVVTALIAAAGIPLLFTFPSIDALTTETDTPEGDSESDGGSRLTVQEAINALRVQLNHPRVRWFVLYASLFTALFVVTRIYEQPALDAVGIPVVGFGILYAGFKLVSAGVASIVGRLHDRFGTDGIMLSLIPIYATAYASILIVPILVVPVLFLNRGLRTLTNPVVGQYLNDRFDDTGRATVLSGASMSMALIGGGARIIAGEITAQIGPVMFFPLAGVGLTAVAGIVWVLFSSVRTGRDTHHGQPESLASGD